MPQLQPKWEHENRKKLLKSLFKVAFIWLGSFKLCRAIEMDNCKNELWSHKGQINHVKDIDSFSLRGVKELSHYIY